MSEVNYSEGAREKRIRELAVMDWANMPSSMIREKFDNVSFQTIAKYRDSEEYRDQLDELRREFKEEMLRLPHTNDLKKKISQGMALSVDVLINILAGNSPGKDKISAARLMSQLDGRFLKGDEGEDGERSRAADSIAAELVRQLEKQRVQ